MIRINLLNTFKDTPSAAGISGGAMSSSEEDIKKQIIMGVVKRMLVLFIGPVGLYIYETQTLPVLQDRLTEIAKQTAELKSFNDSKQGLAEQIRRFEEDQSRFNAQMDFINKITYDKVNEYKLFQFLKESTPDTVWISKLELIDSTINMTVESDDTREIDKFVDRIGRADFITNVTPQGQNRRKDYGGITGLETIIFTLRAQLTSENIK